MARLMEYDFPGNVRELSNLIEHAAIFCTGDTICIEHFPIDAFSADTRQEAPHGPGSPFSTLEDLEMKKIISAISDAKVNKSEAARRLGIHKTTLLRKLKQLKAGQDGPA
jgi:DNA-binding NtrC family response regulator